MHALKLREKTEAGQVAVLEAEKNLQAMTRKKEQVECCILEQLQALQKVQDQLNSMDVKQKATEQKAENAELKMKQLQDNMERLRTEKIAAAQGMREHLKELRKMQLEAEEKAVILAGEKGRANMKVNHLKVDITQLINKLHSGKKVPQQAKSRHEKLEGSDSDEGSKKNEMKSKETETKKYSPDAGPSKNEKKGKDRMMKQQQVSEAEAERNSKSEAEFEKAGVKSEARAKVKKKEMGTKKDSATLNATNAKRQRLDNDPSKTTPRMRQNKEMDEAQSAEARTHVSNFNEDLRRLL